MQCAGADGVRSRKVATDAVASVLPMGSRKKFN